MTRQQTKTVNCTDELPDQISMSQCRDCGGDTTTKQDGGGEYEVCIRCGLRQDGLGHLQQRFW